MRLTEHETKEIFRRYGIPVPHGGLCKTPEEVGEHLDEFPGDEIVLKVNYPIMGGRGKKGAVIIVKKTNAVQAARELFSKCF